uniref:phage protein NinX family protein n=1 Tax=Rheinheimera sp. TaxID=1869214 RepID=UPI004048323D
MRIKISELNGAALDYAVAVTIHGSATFLTKPMMSKVPYVFVTTEDGRELRVSYSTRWAECGPLIGKFKIDIEHQGNDVLASIYKPHGLNDVDCFGSTGLIAICRAAVACKLGNEVEIPEELLAGAA